MLVTNWSICGWEGKESSRRGNSCAGVWLDATGSLFEMLACTVWYRFCRSFCVFPTPPSSVLCLSLRPGKLSFSNANRKSQRYFSLPSILLHQPPLRPSNRITVDYRLCGSCQKRIDARSWERRVSAMTFWPQDLLKAINLMMSWFVGSVTSFYPRWTHIHLVQLKLFLLFCFYGFNIVFEDKPLDVLAS